jgi:hypothetical protein
MGERRTVGPEETVSPAAVASIPMIRAISWTRALVSRALVVLDRSWESLAWRHGCVETWTLGGRDEELMLTVYGGVEVDDGS